MKLLAPVMLLMLSPMTESEVVQDFFTTCPQFFANNMTPSVLAGVQYKQICQKCNTVYEFATLYDTFKKIPVYSAYRYTGSFGTVTRKTSWYIEPQLESQNYQPDMGTESKVTGKIRNQAVNADYEDTCFDRGHLFPVSHSKSNRSAAATFTLTNSAPQSPSFNRGQWRVLEKKVKGFLTDNCINKGYSAFIVTGVVPGNKPMEKTVVVNDQVTTQPTSVNVPAYFWTAFCCIDQNDRKQSSGGYYGLNENVTPKEADLLTLDTFLTDKYGSHFQVFAGKC